MNEAVDGHGTTTDAAAPLAGVAVYTMFRGDPTQLLQWCNFHLTAGAARLYVVLDRPPDGGGLPSLAEDARVHCEVVDQQTWDRYYPPGSQNVETKQVDAFRWMARRAEREGHRYLAFVDADELLALAEPFTDVAARHPDAAAVTVPVREMWYAQDDPTSEPFGATLALSVSSPRQVSWSSAFGWRAQFLRNGLLGHDAGKSVYRLPLASGDLTVHRPRSGSMATTAVELPRDSGSLLHFDSGSVATWNAKWGGRLQGRTVATGLGPHRQAQQLMFSHELRQPPERQQAFFREFYSLDPPAQTLLESAGLLERVDARVTMSGPLPVSPTGQPNASTGPVRLTDTAERVDFQFAMVCDQRFVRPTFATMTSVVAQMGGRGSLRFVVLGDGLDAEDVAHLRSLEHTAFDVRVAVHDITADLDRDVGTEDRKRATFGRIYLIDYLPEQRTVYLDGDVLATRPFDELFELDLGTACLAGAPDSAALRLVANPAQVPVEQQNRLVGVTGGDPLEYLNGGVLILDLDNPDFRSLALQSRALVVLQGRALRQRDQDAMNIAFAGRKHRLGSEYNYMTQFYVSDRCLDGDLMRRRYDAADATLIHFSGRIKPWESPEAEFYNGLYRRLVADAEERVGVSCGFYFSRPAPPRRDWTADRWVEVLEPPRGGPHPPERVADIAVLDLCDDGAYLRLSAPMYESALASRLRLTARVRGETLFEVPLDRLGPQQAHLSERVGRGVRKLSFDLPEALETCGGVTRCVELVVTGPDPDGDLGFARSVGVVDVLAAGTAARPHLLGDAGVDGVVESLADGWLSGWYRSRSTRSGETLSLHVDGELVVMRRPPPLRRPDLPDDERTRGFRFHLANLKRLGYGSAGEVSVRLSGTNIPLRGTPVTVDDVGADLRYDAERDVWVKPPEHRPPVAERLRRRLRKA
jgi:lipopolysaccharide biosynthesis glycosyltransferase